MRLLSMKAYLSLLWGISVLFSMDTKTSSLAETSTSNSTAEPNMSDRPLTIAHVSVNETETQPVTWNPTDRPGGAAVAATAETNVSAMAETKKGTSDKKSDSSNSSTAGSVVMDTVEATTSSSGLQFHHKSMVVTKAAGNAQLSNNTLISDTAKPQEAQSQQQLLTTSSDMTDAASPSAITSAAEAVLSTQPPFTTKPDVPSELSSNNTSSDLTQAPHFTSSPSASTATTLVRKPPSEVANENDTSSLPDTVTEKSTSSAPLSSSSQPLPDTRTSISSSRVPGTTGSSSTTWSLTTTVSNDSAISASAVSTSPAGTLIPHVPGTNLMTRSTQDVPREVSKSPTVSEVQPCSSRGLVKQCLIAITCLGGLATFFMVSTIILCTKLSARKHKFRRPQQATELMCISSLLPERNYTYTRQRSPVTNGVLVFPVGGDSDEEGEDNLTVSSFLP